MGLLIVRLVLVVHVVTTLYIIMCLLRAAGAHKLVPKPPIRLGYRLGRLLWLLLYGLDHLISR
jgi:hypothetical protein